MLPAKSGGKRPTFRWLDPHDAGQAQVLSAGRPTIAGLRNGRGKPQVFPCVVESISIDVVDALTPRGLSHHKPVHGDVPVGASSNCVPVFQDPVMARHDREVARADRGKGVFAA